MDVNKETRRPIRVLDMQDSLHYNPQDMEYGGMLNTRNMKEGVAGM